MKWYTRFKLFPILNPGSPEHVDVRKELDQLLTWAVGSGVLVQVSIKATRKESQCA